jgi:hypothetical protein
VNGAALAPDRFRAASAIRLLLTVAACSTAAPPPYTAEPGRLRWEATQALQGATPAPFFTDEQLEAATEAIVAVRNRFPEVRDVGAAGQLPLTIVLTDSAWAGFVSRFPDAAGDTLRPRTGLRQLDSLNAALGARGVRIAHRLLGREVDVVFTRPANVPALAALYRRLPDVRSAGPTLYVGGGSSMGARLAGDTVRLTLSRGWGDCMSGCIYHRTYVFTYDRRTRRVAQLSDSGDPTPTAGLEAWLRRPDWAAFDQMSEEARGAYADAMARDRRTPIRVLRELAPRLRTLDEVAVDEVVARRDVRRDPILLARLASLGSVGAPARAVLFDEHGLALARNPRTPEFALRALLEEYTRRDPPPLEISRLLVRNPGVLGDREMLLHLLREGQMLDEVRAEGCRAYAAREYPYWERTGTTDGSAGPWYSRVPCPELRPPLPSP